MTNLTEKWKKGELPSGYYYVKNEFGNIFPSDYSESYDSINDTVIKDFFTEVSEITEVLAEVPSYEEWKAAQEQLHKDGIWYTEISHKKVLKENAQLKELLKQAETQIIAYKNNDTLPERAFYEKEVEELLTKIDEALQ